MEIAKKAKEKNAFVVMGGAYTKFVADNIVRNRRGLIDAVVVDEGEVPFLKIVKGEPLPQVENLVYMGENGVERTEPVRFDRNSFPIPDRKLIDLKPYFEIFEKNSWLSADFKRSLNMESHHGCNWFKKGQRCIFCALPDLETRLIGPERTWEEISYLRNEFGADYINLHADEFLLDKKWFERFYKTRIDPPPAIRTLARADRIDEDTARKLKEMNFHQLFIGIESGDESVLRGATKGESLKTYEKAVCILADNDIKLRLTYVLGLPGETEKSVDNTLKFAEKLISYGNTELLGAGMLLPLPGSRAYSMMMCVPELRKKYSDKDIIPIEEMKQDWVEHFCDTDYEFLERKLEKLLALAPSHGFANKNQ